MAISTNTISTSIEWAKRLMYERNPVVSNTMEPALTSANMVMQTILGPPFSWWWNAEDVTFTVNPVTLTGTITNVALTSNVVTLTTSTVFPVGSAVLFSNVGTATFLNGQSMIVASSNGTITTGSFVHADYVSAADTGTISSSTTQDYTVAVPEFSHIDSVAILDIGQTPSKWIQLTVKNDLELDSSQARPRFICPRTEDSNGNMVFRVLPAPDKAYNIVLHLQKAPTLLAGVNTAWSPIPDFMSYIYNWGFLALMYLFADDPRFPSANQKFTSGLLARAEGLTQEEKNIFLNNWNQLTMDQTMQMQQGIQARQV